jgi:hypothetical protein
MFNNFCFSLNYLEPTKQGLNLALEGYFTSLDILLSITTVFISLMPSLDFIACSLPVIENTLQNGEIIKGLIDLPMSQPSSSLTIPGFNFFDYCNFKPGIYSVSVNSNLYLPIQNFDSHTIWVADFTEHLC